MLVNKEKRINDRDNKKFRDIGSTNLIEVDNHNCDRPVPVLKFITKTGLVPTSIEIMTIIYP